MTCGFSPSQIFKLLIDDLRRSETREGQGLPSKWNEGEGGYYVK